MYYWAQKLSAPVTSLRWDCDNTAATCSKRDWSLYAWKHSDHCKAKMTEQSREQAEESTTTNPQKLMKSHPRQSQSRGVQWHDEYTTNCLRHDFALDCHMFQWSAQWYFLLLVFTGFLFYVCHFSYILSLSWPKTHSEQKCSKMQFQIWKFCP